MVFMALAMCIDYEQLDYGYKHIVWGPRKLIVVVVDRISIFFYKPAHGYFQKPKFSFGQGNNRDPLITRLIDRRKYLLCD